MKIKIAELDRVALDWAVAKALQQRDGLPSGHWTDAVLRGNFAPATNWSQSGPIIEREGIELLCNVSSAEAGWFKEAHPDWFACLKTRKSQHWHGTTPLIAAMRCFVASRLGDEVDVPDELLED